MGKKVSKSKKKKKRPMTLTNPVESEPLSPCLCSRPPTYSCAPASVFKLGSIKLIYFSKLQLQFGFVSLKLHPGPLD